MNWLLEPRVIEWVQGSGALLTFVAACLAVVAGFKGHRLKGYILLSVVLLTLVAVVVATRAHARESRPTRIVIMLPLAFDRLGSVGDDGERQALGVIELLRRKPELTKRFDFVIKDHENSEEIAKKIVISELANGTENFVVTMSKVAVPLSKVFEQLVVEHAPRGGRARLIATVSSSPAIQTLEGSIYRFYIRSQEEGRVLADAANEWGADQTATMIYVDDDYGHGAVKEFRDGWSKHGNKVMSELPIPGDYVRGPAKEKVAAHLRALAGSPDVVFVAHFGAALSGIVEALVETDTGTRVVATSTFSIPSWREPIGNLDRLDWLTSVPDLVSGETFHGDVVQEFVYFTLDRLTRSIELARGNHEDFHQAWENCEEPKRIKHEIEGGDSKIAMRAMSRELWKRSLADGGG